MSFKIYFEDGKGNAMDEDGLEPVQMEIDEEAYPLDDITNYDSHIDLKPAEKKNIHRGNDTKDLFFFYVYEKGLTAGKAASLINIPRKTGYNWLQKDQSIIIDQLEGKSDGSDHLKENRGRKKLLNADHKQHLEETFGENASTTIDQAMDSLTTHFEGLKVSQKTVRDFMVDECALSFKKAYFYPTERNSPEKIQQRYEWVINWSKTDIDYQSNCVFIDEAAFHVNLKRTMAWSKKGERAIVETPITRAQTTTILGAISPHGIINVKVRRPYQSVSKKRKLLKTPSTTSDSTGPIKTTGTVTGHYFNFIASTLNVLDQHEQFKGFYIVMDNVPIHKNVDIERYIVNRGYGCVYLPPYSPELNPIEQFWSVVKSKLKREKLLEKETLTTRISDACNSILFSDLQGFCRYSDSKWQVCRDRLPL
ncbi:hypothetical protein INT47_008600 [Mucor saturninus]|uniref:Tc1-like transposase DDE domain-containing protein n=1 Tax=Mucor saturninus TaxID=64648 RepID=A0A8H7URQ5_9FUNG|nr:hypothetical protein INT47_008600 [Mucor saturninus]